MIETRSKACYFFELYENGAPDRERYGVLQKNMEYSKRKKSERSDKNSERSGVQRCKRDMQRCKKVCTQKEKKCAHKKMAIDPLDKPLPCLKIWSTDPSKT